MAQELRAGGAIRQRIQDSRLSDALGDAAPFFNTEVSDD